MSVLQSVPALVDGPASCCGCGACRAACPKGAVGMEPDGEGFLYPVIDEALCIRCGRCLAVCSFKARQRERRAAVDANGGSER